MSGKPWVAIIVVQLILTSGGVNAAVLSVEALDNATVQPGGPRAGSGGKAFFNVEGELNGNFASYGVADFNFGPLPHISAINSAKLTLTQSNASFSTAGVVYILMDMNPTLAGIQPGTSPLAYVPPGYGYFQDEAEGDLDLDFLFGVVGPDFEFYPLATGIPDTYSFFLAPWQSTAMLNQLNSAGTIRIVIAPCQPWVAATWAGSTNASWAGPTLELDVEQVPEPSSMVLVLVGGGLCRAVRRATAKRRT